MSLLYWIAAPAPMIGAVGLNLPLDASVVNTLLLIGLAIYTQHREKGARTERAAATTERTTATAERATASAERTAVKQVVKESHNELADYLADGPDTPRMRTFKHIEDPTSDSPSTASKKMSDADDLHSPDPDRR